MPKKKPMEGKPEVHRELDGFEMGINEFGEITINTEVDKLNTFLNKHVDDKKFKDMEEIPYAQKKRDDNIPDDDDDINDLEDDLTDEDFDDDDDDEYEDDDAADEKDEATGKKTPYTDDSKHEYEDIEELVKNMEKDFGKRGKPGVDDEESEKDDFDDEAFLDEYADEFGEEDNYNLDEPEDTDD